MADKEKEASKVVLERTYNVPLRRYFQKEKYYKRTKRAVSGLREFLAQHMKVDKFDKDTKIKIGKYLNLELWKHGIKNPPHHVRVKVTKDDKGIVFAELVSTPAPRDKKKDKAKNKKSDEKVAAKKEKISADKAEKAEKNAKPEEKKAVE
jgi:ribosomal protein L31E